MKHWPAMMLLLALLAACHHGDDTKPAPGKETRSIEKAIGKLQDGDWRAPASITSDSSRHPAPTLAFFGIEPAMTVLEIRSDEDGYADLLAPYLRKHGHYIVALGDAVGVGDERTRNALTEHNRILRDTFAGNSDVYGRAGVIGFSDGAPELGAAESADAVLSLGGAHVWVAAGAEKPMFAAIFEVLRPGGVFGLVESRASGGLSEPQAIALALKAGFRFDQRSDINAATDAAADRMTLRFVKPADTK